MNSCLRAKLSVNKSLSLSSLVCFSHFCVFALQLVLGPSPEFRNLEKDQWSVSITYKLSCKQIITWNIIILLTRCLQSGKIFYNTFKYKTITKRCKLFLYLFVLSWVIYQSLIDLFFSGNTIENIVICIYLYLTAFFKWLINLANIEIMSRLVSRKKEFHKKLINLLKSIIKQIA